MRTSTTATPAPPLAVQRLDYRPPAFWIDDVSLEFDLGEDGTEVRARLRLRRNPDHPEQAAPLELHGEELETLGVSVDGQALRPGQYTLEPERLTLPGLGTEVLLETRVRIQPQSNTQLSGLYRSNGIFATQCEAEGFRRITWFLDRPDVMARYRVTIRADQSRYPVLLSNGNRLSDRTLPDGRHEACWEDPFKKPSYLFALVAGNLACHRGEHTTSSGRTIQLELWVEPHQIEKCEHALVSLQKSMAWDERRFGREYDLDLYMIVAVDDFNMGAMENKGLNLFNSKLVLASAATATDDDYERIESVVAHEYFHNWTGNRVTCRDWFQLTLKEGLTVFRDQLFSADQGSAAVKRIADVANLRTRQFPEDAGPMAHPIRPESYISMDNFYTATVYEKGAEVIRMLHTLLGEQGFRRGMDLYFERHDGQAVTCDDFRAALADANGRDFAQFERWYSQAGTPRLAVTAAYDGARRSYRLTFRQEAPAGQDPRRFRALHLPVGVGLLGPDGADLPLVLAGEDPARAVRSRVLELTDREQSFEFQGLAARPVPSLLRGFSAPVLLDFELSDADLAFLFAHDADPFQRWEAGQRLYRRAILSRLGQPDRPLERELVEAFRAVLCAPGIDDSFRALALALPSELELAQALEVVDPEALHAARRAVREGLTRACAAELGELWESRRPNGPYQNHRAAIDQRRLANMVLACLCAPGDPRWLAAAAAHFDAADNMTDAQAALGILAQHDVPERSRALVAFQNRWKQDNLVLDKWYTAQATSCLPATPARVRALLEAPDFLWSNPNRVRALVMAFASSNHVAFHARDGAGYRLVADAVLRLQGANPQIAARLAGAFNQWRRYEPGRRAAMGRELERIAAQEGLSKDVFEIVTRALA
jgi:aminopeptidase N